MVEVFGEAKAVLAGESEAHVITGVDGRRAGVIGFAQIVAGGDAGFVFGNQTPHLAAENAPSVIELCLAPRLTQTERVTVGLRGRRGVGGRKEVTRHIAGEFYVVQTTVDVDRWTRLAARAEELRQIALGSARHGQGVQRRGQVGGQSSRSAHKCSFSKASGGDGDAFEVNGDYWTLQRIRRRSRSLLHIAARIGRATLRC